MPHVLYHKNLGLETGPQWSAHPPSNQKHSTHQGVALLPQVHAHHIHALEQRQYQAAGHVQAVRRPQCQWPHIVNSHLQLMTHGLHSEIPLPGHAAIELSALQWLHPDAMTQLHRLQHISLGPESMPLGSTHSFAQRLDLCSAFSSRSVQ